MSDRLVPLPRRAPGEDELVRTIAASPTATVDDLLERTDHLLRQLEADIADLQRDQQEEQVRIEHDARERSAAAAAAIAQLTDLAGQAQAIAENKARTDILQRALSRPAPAGPSATFPDLVRQIEQEIRLARGITGAIRLATIGELLVRAATQVDHLSAEAEAARARLIHDTRVELRSEGKEARASYEIGMSVVRRDLRALDLALPPSGLAWADERWERWDGWDPLPGGQRWIRLGDYVRPELERFRFPALVAMPGERGLAIDVATGDRAAAVGAAGSLLLRLLAAVPAGDARFTIVDPVGLGESAGPVLGLADWSPDLLDGGVATTEADIERHLAALVDHVHAVARDHLRGGAANLAAHHEAIGEVVEPYRFVFVFDYPNRLTDRAREALRELVDHGPRSGVHPVVVTAPGAARAHGSRWKQHLAGLTVVRGGPDGYSYEHPVAGRWRVDLDALIDPAPVADDGSPTLAGRIVATTGRQAREVRRGDVTCRRVYDLLANALMLRVRDDLPEVERVADLDDPATWWTASAATNLAVPLGRAAGRDVAMLRLDSGGNGGALVGGEPGSGVSTLLRTAVTGWSVLYRPDELELWLVDVAPEGLGGFGPDGSAPAGAGFERYAREALPHARLVAPRACRELAASVLDELHRELDRRTTLLEPHGGERAGIAGYRAATGRPLARVVAVIDGADRLFATDDRVAERASGHLDELVRRGPAHGIHLVLAVQRAGPVLSLGLGSAEHLRVRMALAGTEEEFRLVLGPSGAEASACTAVGEAVLAGRPGLDLPPVGDGTGDGGAGQAPPSGQRFRTAILAAHEEGIVLRDLRRLADAGPFADRRPQVHDARAPARLEDSAVRRLTAGAEMRPARRRPRLWLGEPIGLGGPVEVTLRREPGANLLVVGADARAGQGLLMAALVSASLVHGSQLDARVLDLMPLESGFGEVARALDRHVPLRLARRRNRDRTYREVLAEIDGRVARQDFSAPPVLVVVNGLGVGPMAAAEADGAVTDDAQTDGGDGDPAEVGRDQVRALERIVRDGPEVGVHAIVWTDRLGSLGTQASRAAVREFALRVVMAMPAEESAMLVDSTRASTLGPHEALLYDEDAGRLTGLRPYLLPSVDFVDRLGAATVVPTGPPDRIVGPRPGATDEMARSPVTATGAPSANVCPASTAG